MRRTPLLRARGVGVALLSSSLHQRTTLHTGANGEQVTQKARGLEEQRLKGLSLSAAAHTKSPSCVSLVLISIGIVVPPRVLQFSESCSAIRSPISVHVCYCRSCNSDQSVTQQRTGVQGREAVPLRTKE